MSAGIISSRTAFVVTVHPKLFVDHTLITTSCARPTLPLCNFFTGSAPQTFDTANSTWLIEVFTDDTQNKRTAHVHTSEELSLPADAKRKSAG